MGCGRPSGHLSSVSVSSGSAEGTFRQSAPSAPDGRAAGVPRHVPLRAALSPARRPAGHPRLPQDLLPEEGLMWTVLEQNLHRGL